MPKWGLLPEQGKSPMLYKLNATNGRFNSIEPVGFSDFSGFGNLEIDLENLIADNILEKLYENEGLMPIFQQRPQQEEADIYALNEKGELIIFELKRSTAGVGAVHQILRYAQVSGQWTYNTLQNKYRAYSGSEDAILNKVHKENFDLERQLDERQFNVHQHLIVIGSAADKSLMNAVKYWKNQGLSIDFLPYRVYKSAPANRLGPPAPGAPHPGASPAFRSSTGGAASSPAKTPSGPSYRYGRGAKCPSTAPPTRAPRRWRASLRIAMPGGASSGA